MDIKKRREAPLLTLWRSFSFARKLCISLLAALVLCLVTVTVSTQSITMRQMEKTAVQNGMMEMQNRAERMQLMLSHINSQANGFGTNAEIYRLIRQEELDAVESYRITMFLRSMMYNAAGVKKQQIFLDLYSSGQSFLIGRGGSSSGTSHYHIAIPDSVLGEDLYCFGPHLASTYGFSLSGQGAEVFSFQRRLYGDEGKVIGTVAFDVELAELRALAFPGGEEIGFLTGNDGTGLVLSQNGSFSDQKTRRILEACAKDSWGLIREDDFDGIAFSGDVKVGNLKLKLVKLIPYQSLFVDVYPLVQRNIVLICLCFLACILAVVLISRRMTRPIRELDGAIRQMTGTKDLSYRVSSKVRYQDRDEVGRLIEETDRMLGTMEELFHRQELLSNAQREAEIRMLQAQINPHFLYNTLQSIASLALQQGEDEIFQYITLLGSRMHYSMDLEKTSAPLQEEFRYVESYLTLQNVRFGYPVEAIFVLSPEAGHIVVPKMTLQPLAENAFRHGQICRRKDTFLKLTGEVEGDTVRIVMEDNGDGCSDERLAELNHELSSLTPENAEARGSHIGLVNILLRLKLFFEHGAEMVLEKPEGGGMRVTITIHM